MMTPPPPARQFTRHSKLMIRARPVFTPTGADRAAGDGSRRRPLADTMQRHCRLVYAASMTRVMLRHVLPPPPAYEYADMVELSLLRCKAELRCFLQPTAAITRPPIRMIFRARGHRADSVAVRRYDEMPFDDRRI